MKIWSTLIAYDMNLRKVMAVYLLTPLFALAVPVGLWVFAQSYSAYLALADRGVQTLATIQKIAETGGRANRNAVTSTFTAADGRTYESKALYAIDGSRHLRPGMKLGVIYQRDLPSNNAPTLSYAKAQLRSIVFFVVLMSGLFSLLAWVYRDKYSSIYARLRPKAYA